MKSIFILLFLLVFTSCKAQPVEPLPPVMVEAPFEVLSINAEEAILFTRQSSAVYRVDPLEGLEAEKEYFFILHVEPGNPEGKKTRKAVILYFEKSEDQVRRENAAAVLFFRKLHPPK